jgi:hypothetical protein
MLMIVTDDAELLDHQAAVIAEINANELLLLDETRCKSPRLLNSECLIGVIVLHNSHGQRRARFA